MNWITSECSKTLAQMYDARIARFCATSSLDGDGLASSWDNPLSVRYTINTLLGLARAELLDADTWQRLDPIGAFLEAHDVGALNVGDRALLVRALVEARNAQASRQAESLLGALSDEGALDNLRLQEACWLVAGLAAAAEAGVAGAAEACHAARRRLLTQYWNRDSLMPLHLPKGGRSRLVSFGGIVYFLWALSEYARVFNDEYVLTIFKELAGRIIALQGSKGEWAWHYDIRKASVVEWYEVYSVHQHSMSMLFLIPALDQGVRGASEAVESSLRWLLGNNQLGVPMYHADPLLFFRSQRRRLAVRTPGMQAGLPRALERAYTYSFSTTALLTGHVPAAPVASGIEVNHECRSYELGWLVYMWSNEARFDWFTSGAWLNGGVSGMQPPA